MKKFMTFCLASTLLFSSQSYTCRGENMKGCALAAVAICPPLCLACLVACFNEQEIPPIRLDAFTSEARQEAIRLNALNQGQARFSVTSLLPAGPARASMNDAPSSILDYITTDDVKRAEENLYNKEKK